MIIIITGKCNAFGLGGPCCTGAKYFVVLRVSRVPKEERMKLAKAAFDSFESANSHRLSIQTKYKRRRVGKAKPRAGAGAGGGGGSSGGGMRGGPLGGGMRGGGMGGGMGGGYNMLS